MGSPETQVFWVGTFTTKKGETKTSLEAYKQIITRHRNREIKRKRKLLKVGTHNAW